MTEKSRTTFTFLDTPPEVAEVVQDILSEYEVLTSRIVDRFTVRFVSGSDTDDFEAAVNIRREYRSSTVFITAEFMRLDEENRRQAICHELAHVFTDPLYAEVLTIIENFVPGDVSAYVEEQVRKQNELAVDDLSRFFVEFKEKGTG
jgi:hypothetical protein